MTTFGVSSRSLAKAGVAVATAAMLAVPALSFAAVFAYVNQQGEVNTVVADSAAQALMVAPNKDERSGVILLVNPADGIVGDSVGGV